MLKHYFTSGRGIIPSLLLIFVIMFSGTGQIAAQPALLDPLIQPKFSNPLPVINDLGLRIDARTGGNFKMTMRPGTQHLGLYTPASIVANPEIMISLNFY